MWAEGGVQISKVTLFWHLWYCFKNIFSSQVNCIWVIGYIMVYMFFLHSAQHYTWQERVMQSDNQTQLCFVILSQKETTTMVEFICF